MDELDILNFIEFDKQIFFILKEYMNAKKLFLMIMVMVCTMLCAFSQQYKVGDDGPGGGIVFYYSEKGFDVYQADGSLKRCNYLEVSKTEVARVTWCTCEYLNDAFCHINTVDDIGMGKMNTYKIVNTKHQGETLSVANCAAKACAEYSTAQTAKGEWFLPSKDELYIMYKNLETRILALASSVLHWSSSQDDDSNAWWQDFSDGLQCSSVTLGTYSVRAIRAF